MESIETKNTDINTFVTFSVGNENFAIPVTKTLEVLQKQNITHIPNSPEHVSGVINFRGEVIPVFETRSLFMMEHRPDNQKYVIIVLHLLVGNEAQTLGAIVDNVLDVTEIQDTEIKEVPKLSKELNSNYLTGITKISENFVMLLNIDKIFSEDEIEMI